MRPHTPMLAQMSWSVKDIITFISRYYYPQHREGILAIMLFELSLTTRMSRKFKGQYQNLVQDHRLGPSAHLIQ